MDRYYLVASKNEKGKFKDEIIINIPNLDLTRLEVIDSFTSEFTKEELISYLKEYSLIENQNVLSIKKESKGKTYYFKVAYKNDLIKYFSNSAIINNKINVISDVKFSEIFLEVQELLNKKEITKFKEVFKNSYVFLHINNYLNCDPFDERDKSILLNTIYNDFLKYENIRKWLVNTKTYTKISSKKVEKIKGKIKTIQENEQDYVDNFNKNSLTSYIDNKLSLINQYDLDSEEFLEPNELDEYENGPKL